MRKHNDRIASMLRAVADAADKGKASNSIEEAYGTALVLMAQAAKEIGVDIPNTLGFLELAKANLLHDYHEIITRSGGTRPR